MTKFFKGAGCILFWLAGVWLTQFLGRFLGAFLFEIWPVTIAGIIIFALYVKSIPAVPRVRIEPTASERAMMRKICIDGGLSMPEISKILGESKQENAAFYRPPTEDELNNERRRAFADGLVEQWRSPES